MLDIWINDIKNLNETVVVQWLKIRRVLWYKVMGSILWMSFLFFFFHFCPLPDIMSLTVS
jgi:hypothetical protein